MTSLELKEKVISQIHITEDSDALEFILEFLLQNDGSNSIYKFSDDLRKRLDISVEQSNNGEVISEEEERKLTEEWLEK
jgi:hypothetical protein